MSLSSDSVNCTYSFVSWSLMNATPPAKPFLNLESAYRYWTTCAGGSLMEIQSTSSIEHIVEFVRWDWVAEHSVSKRTPGKHYNTVNVVTEDPRIREILEESLVVSQEDPNLRCFSYDKECAYPFALRVFRNIETRSRLLLQERQEKKWVLNPAANTNLSALCSLL